MDVGNAYNAYTVTLEARVRNSHRKAK